MKLRAEAAGTQQGGPQDRLVDTAVAAALVAIVVWRLVLFYRYDEPVGVDVANWVRIFQSWIGRVDVEDALMPPLVPLFAGTLDAVVGLRHTSHILMSFGSIGPAAGIWWACRGRSPSVPSVLAVVAVAFAGATSAATAWGGLPQLVGFGALPVLGVRAVSLSRHPARTNAVSCGRWLVFVAATSTLAFVIAAVVVCAGMLLGGRPAWVERGWVPWLAIHLVPIVAFYGVVLSRMTLPDDRATSIDGPGAVWRVLAPFPAAWLALLVLAVIPVGRTTGQWSELQQAAAAVVLAAVVVSFSGDIRFTFVAPTAIALSVCAAASAPHSRERAFIASTLVLTSLITVAGFPDQAKELDRYSKLVPNGMTEASTWLADRVDADESVLVAPVAGAPTGWIVEAHGVDALVASRPDWLFFPDERAEAAAAVELLSGRPWPTDEDLGALETYGVRWVLLPAAWGGADETRLDELEQTCPAAVPIRSSAYTIIKPDARCRRP